MSPKDQKQMEQNIIESAEELFMEKGYAMTSTTEIAKKAGCNQTLVHYYFRTKEKLFHAIFERKFKYFISSFKEIGDSELPFEEKVRGLIDTHFEAILKHPELPFFLLNELTTNPARIEMMKEKVTTWASEIFFSFDSDLKKAIKEGRIRKMETADLLITIVSLNLSVFLLNPILTNILDLKKDQFMDYARKRKNQNIEMVLNSLKPV